jgi:hypothetical protein
MMRECDFKVTLLGTGTPIPRKDRFGGGRSTTGSP